LPLFIIKKGDEKINIVPLRGTGLWGPIWGNIALKDDFKTVVGVTFDHKSEVGVVKGGIKNMPADLQIHNVDAISGGTITSKGVSAMLNNVLESYVPYIQKRG